MKKTAIGFILILVILLMAWLLRNLIISTIFLPLLLGAMQFARLINSIPQFVWWIFICIFSLSLFFVNMKFPEIDRGKKRSIKIDRSRLDILDSLINETVHSSTYSGQKLSLLLINLYLKSKSLEETNIHGMDKYLNDETFPDAIKNFVLCRHRGQGQQRSPQEIRQSLENAVNYLNRTIPGDQFND